MFRLQIRGPSSGSRHVVNDLSSSSSLNDLRSTIAAKTGVDANEQRLMSGFPPKEVPPDNPNASLANLGIKSGDSIMVEKASSSARGIVQAKQGSGVAVFSIPRGKGYFARREMPADNSCLFHSIAYTCANRARGQADQMRSIVKNEVLSKPQIYNTTLLGQSPRSYCDWIMGKNTWGGAIELGIFANHFQTEIVGFDPVYLREDVYGQGQGFEKRAFVLFSSGQSDQGQHSAHYDALVFSPFGNASEGDDKVVFGSADMYAWERARNFIEHLHKEATTKDSSIKLQKKWRRSKSGAEVVAPQGHVLGASSTLAPTSAISSSASASGKWSCKTCTFLNHDALSSCEMCGTSK